ncbi:MAG: hypothetical protein WDO24_20545 [Pseudomonadota bacterium]
MSSETRSAEGAIASSESMGAIRWRRFASSRQLRMIIISQLTSLPVG